MNNNSLKKIIIILILLFPGVVLAQSLVLPFNLDIIAENQAKENSLIFAYGREAFFACDSSTRQTRLNPYLFAKNLREIEFCLLNQEIKIANCFNGKIDSAGACIIIDTGCKERYGHYSYATGNIIANNNECECASGYVWNENKDQCVAPCQDDKIFYSPYRDSKKNILHPFCISKDIACEEEFGKNHEYKESDDYGRVYCQEAVIVAGFESSEAEINYDIIIKREQNASVNIDINLANRLKGRILLQVEERGEAWYINPTDNYRYYLSSPKKALAIMRELGLGATHEFITTYKYYPVHVLGKILIDVDDFGKAYYINPVDKKAYYLGGQNKAFSVMRELGLGISNSDIRKIFVAQ
ncbi:MAG: hypothetical protein U9Q85_00345 [Patescibacteria group bacterium]|nr:hypothetical protein [Patescibacteria group bacterium]